MALASIDVTRIFGVATVKVKDTAKARIGHPNQETTLALTEGAIELFLNTSDHGVPLDGTKRGLYLVADQFMRFTGEAVVLAVGDATFYLKTHPSLICCPDGENSPYE